MSNMDTATGSGQETQADGAASQKQGEAVQQQTNGAQDQGQGGDDLDALLAEFDQYHNTEPQGGSNGSQLNPSQGYAAKNGDGGQTDSEGNYVTREELQQEIQRVREREKAEQQAEKDINEAVKTVKGELNVPDTWVRGILEREAMSDERFYNAFVNRDKNPQTWNKILKAKNREIAKTFGGSVDKEASQSADAVESAVRSAATQSPKGSNKGDKNPLRMSPKEYEQYRQSVMRGKR